MRSTTDEAATTIGSVCFRIQPSMFRIPIRSFRNMRTSSCSSQKWQRNDDNWRQLSQRIWQIETEL